MPLRRKLPPFKYVQRRRKRYGSAGIAGNENICKSFPGVKALDNVSLTVRPGTVHALMGENGAGKSTLMKCLFGIYSKDSGTITLEEGSQLQKLQGGHGKRRRHGASGAQPGPDPHGHRQPLAGPLPQGGRHHGQREHHAQAHQGDLRPAGGSCGPQSHHVHHARFPAADGGDRQGRQL